jgi:hypothetical protein
MEVATEIEPIGKSCRSSRKSNEKVVYATDLTAIFNAMQMNPIAKGKA